ncbi:cyclase family protein [Microbacterium yannicii]|uniref:cyclase family protein n=1 Tax=Microbacterium yannicii TaxID=671622 RepID=UPI0002E3DEDD|nr:cyclase family protein [Microbacterium yannicii]
MPASAQHRAHFDFDIRFGNGGALSGTGFRLDLPSADVSEKEIARLLIQHLGLALVSDVELRGLRIVEEPHRGSRGVDIGSDAAATGAGRIVDLSHPIRAGLVTYPGLPAPTITPHLTREDSRSRYAPGTEFAMDVITMIGNTGTYLDSPFHRYAEGSDLAGLDLSSLVGLRAEVFHLADSWDAESRGIRPEMLADRDVRGAAVLLHTGWDRWFGRPEYGSGASFLTGEGAQWLIDAGAVLVGIDSLNIDDTESGGERPAHSLLLGAGVHVVEHLTNLGELPPRGARFTAAPPAVEGFGTFPVRAFGEIAG